jgi:hypothetical protein
VFGRVQQSSTVQYNLQKSFSWQNAEKASNFSEFIPIALGAAEKQCKSS